MINTSIKYVRMKGFKKYIHELWSAFSDINFETKQEMTTPDKIIILWTMSATNTGIYHSAAPTNKKVSASGVDIFQIEHDKIVEIWNYNSLADLLTTKRSKHALKGDYVEWMSNESFVQDILTKLHKTGYPLEYISRLNLKALGYRISHRYYNQKNHEGKLETREIDIFAVKELSSFMCSGTKIYLNICLIGDCKYSSTNDFLVFESETNIIPKSFPVLFNSKAILNDISNKDFSFPSIFQVITSFDSGNLLFQTDDNHIYPGCSQVINAFSHFLAQSDKEWEYHYKDIYKNCELHSKIASKLPRTTIEFGTGKILSFPTKEELEVIQEGLKEDHKKIEFLEIRIGIPIIILDKNNGLIRVRIENGNPIGLEDVGYGVYLFSPSNLMNYRRLIPQGISEFPVLVCNMTYLQKAIKALEQSLLAMFTVIKEYVVSNPVNLFLEIYHFIQRLGLQGYGL